MTDLNACTDWRLDHIEKSAALVALQEIEGVEGLDVYINLAKAKQELSLHLLSIHDPEYYEALMEDRRSNG